MAEPRRSRARDREPADVFVMLEALSKARLGDGDVSTNHYLAATNQLVSLFHQMSKGLGLCLHDAGNAIKSLEIQCVSGAQCHYNSLGLMLQFETSNNLVGKQGRIMSGMQAVVKLHHAQSFMLKFLRHLKMALETNQPFSTAARVQVYQSTLGKHRSRFAQAGAKVILTQTAGRHKLIKSINKSSHGLENPIQLLDKILEAGEPIYQDTDSLLKTYGNMVNKLQV